MRIVLGFLLGGGLVLGGLMTAVFIQGKQPNPTASADVIIVLGARVMEDGELSTTLEYRIKTAYEMYEKGLAGAFILCGAQGKDEPVTEAAAMAEYLYTRGVPLERVFLEDQSYNTRQNLDNAREIMRERGYQTAMLVSSDYHVARALWMCQDADINAVGVRAPGPDYWHNRIKARARESLSWVYYFVFGGG